MEVDVAALLFWMFHLRRPWNAFGFAVLKDGPRLPGGRFGRYGDSHAVAPWPHQEIVARRLVEAWPTLFFCYVMKWGLGQDY